MDSFLSLQHSFILFNFRALPLLAIRRPTQVGNQHSVAYIQTDFADGYGTNGTPRITIGAS